MKLLYLELQAFGAFPNKEVINFDAFEKDKIFLISGKTGSGKTTIFDAISYALFGKTTLEYKNDDMLRSHYANAAVETYVKVIFKEKDQSYEVYRKPPFTKVGRKTKIGPEATLREVGKEEFIANKSSIVTSEIERIVGFKHEQFRQIVVLPQGEFIKILNSKSDDKEKLLSSLLNTSIYNDISKKLSEENTKYKNEIETIKNQIDNIYLKHDVIDEEELKQKGKEANSNYLKAKDIYEDLNNKLTSKKIELNNYITLNDMKAKEIEVNNNLSELLKSKDEIENNRNLLCTLNNVKQIKIEYDKLRLHIENKKRFLTELNIVNEKLVNAKSEYDRLSAYNQEKENLYNEKLKLNNELNKIKTLKADNIRLNNFKESIKDDEEILDKINIYLESNDLDNFKKQIDDINYKIEDLKKEASSYNPLTLEKLESQKRIYDTNNKLKNTISLAKEENNLYRSRIKVISDTIILDQEEYDRLKSIYTNNSLEKFVYLIENNKPCPLCGSLNHPHTLKKVDEHINKESIDDLSEKINNNKIEKAKLEEKIANNENLISNNEGLIDQENEIDIDLINSQILKETQAKTQYNKNLKIIVELEELLAETKKKYNDEEKILENKKIEKSKVSERITINNQHVLELIQKINEELEGKSFEEYESINSKNILVNTTKLNQIESKILLVEKNYTEALANYESITKNLKDLENTIIDANNNVSKLLEKYNISENDYCSYEAKLSIISEIENKINEYDNEVLNLNGMLKMYKENLKGYEIVDTNALSIEIDNLSILYDGSKLDYEKALEISTSISNDYQNVLALLNNNEKKIKKFEMVNELYRIANGSFSGVQKITLQKYILGIILDQIIVYANKYLKTFTSNRYLLQRMDTDSTSYRGLDLAVSDVQTGQTRSVGTLSGGESFMCALALAIGMSEGISSMSGGIKLENIFIDEGFGSLDSEALDNAIEALVTLASNGRMVGIISHVQDIKNRIPNIIEVIKSTKGSKILN